jgi:hypothetical protein
VDYEVGGTPNDLDPPGDLIGRPVNGWQLRFVKGPDSITKTSYASLSTGRIIIDVYGHGPDGFVPGGEILDMAERVRNAGLGLLELIDRAEESLRVRFQLFRNRNDRELHLSGFTRDRDVQVYDFRCSSVEAAEKFLRDLMGTAACLPPL